MAEIMLKVDGVEMPCPSSFQWGLQDISASESGRTDDSLMHKNNLMRLRSMKSKTEERLVIGYGTSSHNRKD